MRMLQAHSKRNASSPKVFFFLVHLSLPPKHKHSETHRQTHFIHSHSHTNTHTPTPFRSSQSRRVHWAHTRSKPIRAQNTPQCERRDQTTLTQHITVPFFNNHDSTHTHSHKLTNTYSHMQAHIPLGTEEKHKTAWR